LNAHAQRLFSFYAYAGSPPQQFHVIPSINGQTLYIPISLDCERYNITDCGSSRGVEVFSSKPSPGFQPNASSTWSEIGIYPIGLGSNFGFNGNGMLGYDNAGLGTGTGTTTNSIALEKLAIEAYASDKFWIGQLGLSQWPMNVNDTEAPHSFLSRLKEEGRIPSLSFGYQIGAVYRK
jgi:hypothetical protein